MFKYLARVQADARKTKVPPASAEEKKQISGSKRGRRATLRNRAPKCMQKLAGLLKAQASQRLRDLQRKKALYPMQTMAAVEKALYCICRSAASDKPMLCCDACEEWFHFACLQLNESDVEESAGWVCKGCEGKGARPQACKEASEKEEDDDGEASSDGNTRQVAASEGDEEEDEEGDEEGDDADDESPSD